MALWKQPRLQPFSTYRDPQTGRWITIQSPEPVEETLVEAPLYRNPQTGQWVTMKPTVTSQNTLIVNSL
jgi:hypothetical protein